MAQLDFPQTRHNEQTDIRPVFAVTGDETHLEIRPIQIDDEERMVKFHKGLSERSVYMRYCASPSFAVRTAHTRLIRVCLTDPERETVLVAAVNNSNSGERNIVGVGRLNKLANAVKAEVALVVLDQFQGRGIGTELLRHLVQEARNQNVGRLEAEMLRDNTTIQRVFKKLGFHLQLIDARSVRAALSI